MRVRGLRIPTVVAASALLVAACGQAHWHEAGPDEILFPNGQYTFATGRINALDSDTNGVLYAGSDGGGVWKTTNSGSSWAPLTDTIPGGAPKVTALRVDPSNSQVVFAGLNSGELDQGVGLYRSADAGATWTQVNGPASACTFFAFGTSYISAIRVNPQNHQEVYVATNSGVAYSSDNGQTWCGPSGALAGRNVTDLDIDKGGTVYAAVPGSGVWIGLHNNWLQLPTLSPVNTNNAGDILKLEIAPSTSSTSSGNDTLYLFHGVASGPEGVYRSTNGGNAWTNICDGNLCGTHNDGDHGTYPFNYVAVDRSNPAIVFVGLNAGLWRTTNGTTTGGSASWTDVRSAAPNGLGLHEDQHGFTQTTKGTFFGNDGGVYLSTDGGSRFSFVSRGLNIVQFHSGSQASPGSNLIAGGVQDNGVIFTVPGSFWTSKLGGDGTNALFDPGNDHNLFADNNGAGTAYSTNSGQTWTPTHGPDNDNAYLLAPLILQPGTSGSTARLYAGATSLWKSNDAMRTWTKTASRPAGFAGAITKLAANSSGALFASDGTHWATSHDGGTTWQPPGANQLPCGCAITDVAIDPNGTLYATAQAPHFYRSLNGGQTWTDVGDLNLFEQWFGVVSSLHAVAVDPINPQTIYAGGMGYGNGSGAVFRSPDQGITWHQLGLGLPGAAVYHLDVARDDSTLAAFTLGRGVWQLPLR